MSGPLKRKRRLCRTALEKLQVFGAYHVAAILAITFGVWFWRSEQLRAKLADRMDNDKGGE
jgi:hypothetical protein